MAKIIASVLAEDVDGMLSQARQALMAGASWLELRIDGLRPLRPEVEPAALLAALPAPCLITCRMPQDGGQYRGSRKQRQELLQRWIDAGAAGLDLEDWEDWQPAMPDSLRLRVRSHHNLTGMTADLPGLRDRLLAMGGNMAKLAVTAHDLAEAAPVLDLLAHTDQQSQPTMAFAMGGQAWPSRVLSCLWGSPFTYAAVNAAHVVAPGQLSVDQLAGIYDLRRFSPQTALFGLLGNPARHSLSPTLFNRAFRMLDHAGIYLPFESSRPQDVLQMLAGSRLQGLSVTAPFKATMLKACHQVDEVAMQVGAVNTLVYSEQAGLQGFNTDVYGVRAALEGAGLQAAVPKAGGKDGGKNGAEAVVLGGGGAARAGAIALQQMGMQVTLMPRSLEPVRDFARQHGFQLARMDGVLLAQMQPRAVVQATPVGGPTHPNERLLPDWQVAAGTYVLDMVYRPRRTRLLQDVAAAGGIAVPGMQMFLHQAAAQLRMFTGQDLPVKILGNFVGEG